MLVVERARQRPGFSIQQKRVRCHAGNVFKNDRMVGRVGRAWSPTEGSVAGYQDCGDSIGIKFGECAANGSAGFEFIVPVNFDGGQFMRHRNGSVEIVSVRRAKAWNGGVGLGPGGGVFRMRMGNASDVRELPVELKVSG